MESYHVTGNEDDTTYSYEYKEGDIALIKSLTKSHSQSRVYCSFEKSFQFPTYHFTIGVDIPYIDFEITEAFLKAYDFSSNTWIKVVCFADKLIPIEPDEKLALLDKVLYNLYVQHCDQIKQLKFSTVLKYEKSDSCLMYGHLIFLASSGTNEVECVDCKVKYNCASCRNCTEQNEFRHGCLTGFNLVLHHCTNCQHTIQTSACDRCKSINCVGNC